MISSPLRAALVAAAIAAAGCSHKDPAPSATPEARSAEPAKLVAGSPHLGYLKIEPVAEAGNAPAVVLTGKVSFDENHTQRVSSPVDGRAIKMLVELGEKVKVGQALVELSSPNVGQLQGDMQKAQQDLALSEKALVRVHKLKEDGAVSDKEVAQAEADNRKARADVASASARLRSLNLAAADPAAGVSLRAQVAGTVVDRSVLVGQEVRADAAVPLLTISDLDVVWVAGDVYEQDIPLVHEGMKVSVSVAAYPGVEFAGTITHMSELLDPVSRTVKLRCVVPNPDGRLKPEMFVKIQLRDEGGKKLVIPSRAVLSETQPPRVVLVGADGSFSLRKVEIGPEVGGRVRVLSGLAPGDKVVTSGAIFLRQEIEDQ